MNVLGPQSVENCLVQGRLVWKLLDIGTKHVMYMFISFKVTYMENIDKHIAT